MIPGISRSPGDVVAEIKMCSTSFRGGFLLLEGPSDSQFFRHHINTDSCQLVICGGKDTAIKSLRDCAALTAVKAIGVVDDDFDRALAVNHAVPNLVSTETHDLETTLLSSAAWERIETEYTDAAKREDFEKKYGGKLLQHAVDLASVFGKLRLINIKYNLSVDFEKYFSPWKFVCEKSWNIDEIRLVDEFIKISGISRNNFDTYFNSLPNVTAWDLVQGHDLLAIISIGFRSGLFSTLQFSEKAICVALRLAYSRDVFGMSYLSSEIGRWEQLHGHRIQL